MSVNEKNILNRFYFVAGIIFVFALAVSIKLINIQVVEGEKYKSLAKNSIIKNVIIPANRGNIYADDGSLLATSVPKYDIRFDAVTVSDKNFNTYLLPLSKSLSKLFGKSVSHYQNALRRARKNKNRYHLIARNVGYLKYIEIKSFPLLKLGAFRGGLIVEQQTVREHPIGKIAERMVGYERRDEKGYYTRVGLEGAFGNYLRGKEGKRRKQKIAKGQWKPISDENEIEPQDGYDVISTLNINIQDIAHHALLKQMEKYKAEHGCVIVMETKTGEVKAISNLGRTSKGTYYEKLNYAIGEAHEPGSTFKLMALVAALDQGVVNIQTKVNTGTGSYKFYGKKINDSKRGGYGEITVGRAFEVSSNIGMARIIDENYKENPKAFVDKLYKMGLNKKLGLPIVGEGNPMIPYPDKKGWSKNALPSLAYGYGLKITPLQTLTFYNAIANNGVMVKPRFIRQVKALNKEIKTFEREILNQAICSKQTLSKVQQLLENVVKRGTGSKLYSPLFSMAGKTGTAQVEYWMKDWNSNKRYASSFAGYFPAKNPRYSCIVIIHKPQVDKGYYGADVAGPVFKRIAQKVVTDSPIKDSIENINALDISVEKDFEKYFAMAQKSYTKMPNLKGMPAMDAITLLEDLGLKVLVKGHGKVVSQSLSSGEKIIKGKTVVLQL